MIISIYLIIDKMNELEERKNELTSIEYLNECNKLKNLYEIQKNKKMHIISNNYINNLNIE